MFVNIFTLPQLAELALCYPEKGSVNFNILLTVLKTLIEETNLTSLRPWCDVENPECAQATLEAANAKPLRRAYSEESRYSESEEKKSSPWMRLRAKKPVKLKKVVPKKEQKSSGKEESLELEVLSEKEETNVVQGREERADVVSEKKESADLEPEEQFFDHDFRDHISRTVEFMDDRVQKLSYEVQWLMDHVLEMDSALRNVRDDVQELEQAYSDAQNEIIELQDMVPPREVVNALQTKTDDIERNKVSKEEFPSILTETVPEVRPAFLNDIVEKVDYVGGAVLCILDETGIPYPPPPAQMFDDDVAVESDLQDEGKPVSPSTPQSSAPVSTKDVETDEDHKKMYQKAEPSSMPASEDMPKHAVSKEGKMKISKVAQLQSIVHRFAGEKPSSPQAEAESAVESPAVTKPEVSQPQPIEPQVAFPTAAPKQEMHKPQLTTDVFQPVVKATAINLNQRFDDVWDELQSIRSSIMKLPEQAENVDKIDNMELMVKNVMDDLSFLSSRVDKVESDSKHKSQEIEMLEIEIKDLHFMKANKEEISEQFDEKADRAELKDKITRKEFDSAVGDLGDSLMGIAENLEKTQHGMESALTDIEKHLAVKLNKCEYHELQENVNKRVNLLLSNFKKMKTVIENTVCHEAAGTIKCLSCGNPCQPSWGQCIVSGGDISAQPKLKDFDEHDPSPFNPDDHQSPPPQGSGISMISLLKPFSGKSQARSGGSEVLSTEQSDKSKKSGPSKLQYLPQKIAAGLKMISNKEKKKELIDAISSSKESLTRFCGGKHTLTEPMQKGIKFTESELSKQSYHSRPLIGTDNIIYKGVISIDEELGADEETEDSKSINIEQWIREVHLPTEPQIQDPSQFHDGSHLTEEALRRGTSEFKPFMFADSPVRTDILQMIDSKVYARNMAEQRCTSAESSQRAQSRTKAGTSINGVAFGKTFGTSVNKPKTVLKPAIISLTLDPRLEMQQPHEKVLKFPNRRPLNEYRPQIFGGRSAYKKNT